MGTSILLGTSRVFVSIRLLFFLIFATNSLVIQKNPFQTNYMGSASFLQLYL